MHNIQSKKPFDVVLGNPPFSKDGEILYPAFFKKALKMADHVAMIMPTNLEKRGRLLVHNQIIDQHQSHISGDLKEHFPKVGLDNIKYVIASEENENNPPKREHGLKSLPILRPELPRLASPIKCAGSTMLHENSGDTVLMVHKVLKTGADIEKLHISQISPDEANERKMPIPKVAKAKGSWFVVVNHTPVNGKFNTYIHENNGEYAYGQSVFPFAVGSHEEALELSEYLTSPEIIADMKSMLMTTATGFTTSLAMIRRLPAQIKKDSE